MSVDLGSEYMKIAIVKVGTITLSLFVPVYLQMTTCGLLITFQGSHWFEKYLNIQDCLEKSFEIKFALKST